MGDSQWDERLRSFLKKTGEDVKRFSRDVKDEAQKLMTEVQDPERQQQLRDGLAEVGTWARRAAEDVAAVVEDGVKKAEVALGKASERVGEFITRPPEPPASVQPQATPPAPPPVMDEAPPPAAAPRPKKTIGRAAKKPASARPPPAKSARRVRDDGEE